MTWSVVHTIANTTGYVDDFMVYFMDTHLPSLPGFTTGPGGDAFERTVKLTCNDIKGGTSSSYTWWSWGSATGLSYQYENDTYTTTPGDNGDLNSSNSLGFINTATATSGSWRIWESDERADGVLVTKGSKGMLFWPGVGSGKWNLINHNAWLAGDQNSNTCIGMATNQYNGIPFANNPVGSATSSAEYQVVPSYNRVSTNNSVESTRYLYTGVGYDFSARSLNNGLGGATGHPALPGGSSDQAVLAPPSVLATEPTLQLSNLSLIQDSVGGNYYFMLGSDLNYMALCLEVGSTEPDLS